jgi:hypothetical protein
MASPFALAFEAFALEGGTRDRLASAVLQYSSADIRTKKRTGSDGAIYWDKTLRLTSGFIVGVIMDATPDVGSLALFADREPWHQGFSFEDFTKQGEVFTHHELGGQLKVSFVARPSPDHLHTIEFLTDVTLRYVAAAVNHLVEGPTHELVVQRGSVLCLQT